LFEDDDKDEGVEVEEETLRGEREGCDGEHSGEVNHE
jgi:hypothetical protein